MSIDRTVQHPELLAALMIAGCTGETATPHSSVAAPRVDMVAPPRGVADRGFDPPVVAVDFGGLSPCAGTLVAPDVVLTARHCVVVIITPFSCAADAGQTPPAPRSPDSLRILVGDNASLATERARAREVLVPMDATLCAGDVAVLLLDRSIDELAPLNVRPTGAARGDHVRTVGFARSGVSAPMKVLRDHLAIVGTAPTELRIAEPMMGIGGGPALDEETGEILGVVSRTDGAASIYTRADVFASLVENALVESARSVSVARGAAKLKKGPVDMGANCVDAADCAAGVCVADGVRQYCSRSCGADDACPTRFHCERSDDGQDICVAT